MYGCLLSPGVSNLDHGLSFRMLPFGQIMELLLKSIFSQSFFEVIYLERKKKPKPLISSISNKRETWDFMEFSYIE